MFVTTRTQAFHEEKSSVKCQPTVFYPVHKHVIRHRLHEVLSGVQAERKKKRAYKILETYVTIQ